MSPTLDGAHPIVPGACCCCCCRAGTAALLQPSTQRRFATAPTSRSSSVTGQAMPSRTRWPAAPLQEPCGPRSRNLRKPCQAEAGSTSRSVAVEWVGGARNGALLCAVCSDSLQHRCLDALTACSTRAPWGSGWHRHHVHLAVPWLCCHRPAVLPKAILEPGFWFLARRMHLLVTLCCCVVAAASSVCVQGRVAGLQARPAVREDRVQVPARLPGLQPPGAGLLHSGLPGQRRLLRPQVGCRSGLQATAPTPQPSRLPWRPPRPPQAV